MEGEIISLGFVLAHITNKFWHIPHLFAKIKGF